MAQAEPLLPKPATAGRSKASMFYNADEYMEDLKKKFEHDHEIDTIRQSMPDQANPHAAGKNKDQQVKIETDDRQRSKVTGRLFPISNKPDPMPESLKFMFSKITAEQGMYMWRIVTCIWAAQCLMIAAYAGALHVLGEEFWWPCTLGFGLPFSYIAIQHIYVDHDVMHGVTFPPYWWQKYLTHPFSDFLSLPWEEFILEHSRHHASTIDLLMQGEFGWDPETPIYWLSNKWYTWPLIPLIHFFGLNDTGGLFTLEWYAHFPDAGPGDKCNKEFWTKWLPRRLKHHAVVACHWIAVYLLGQLATGNGLGFLLTVSFFARCGYGSAWIFITNFTHSIQWNQFLANDPDRSWPILHAIMAFVLGGRHRWNEMLFHDVHHAFPNAMGTLSQRGRFNHWEKVHDAAVEILARGLFKPNGDEETEMMKINKKRSMLLSTRVASKQKVAVQA